LENNERSNINNNTSSSGDRITVGNVSGTGIVFGKNITIGSININSLNKELEKVPNEYAKSLTAFAENLNKEFEEYKVPEVKAKQIQKSIVDLGKQVEDVTPDKEGEINYIKQTKIEAQTVDLVDKVLDAIPPAAETVALFTPLYPVNKLIRKGVQEVVNKVKESRSGK